MSIGKAIHNGDNPNGGDCANYRGGAPAYAGMSPLEFVRDVLGDDPYDKQEEILRAVGEAAQPNSDIRRVSVVGCNSSGKDWTAARAILWWMCTHSPAKVAVTGPTGRQVNDIVWNEVRQAHAQSNTPLPGKVRKVPLYEMNDDSASSAKGFTSNSPYNLQGYHSPNMMVVVTEAHAVKEEYMNALLLLNPKLILMVGNPFTQTGTFYDSHHSKRHKHLTIHISAMDTPNIAEGRIVTPGLITQKDIDERKDDWGEDSDMYINSVLAEFTENLDNVLIPLSAARRAAERDDIEPEGEVILACDIARTPKSKTVIAKRQGGKSEILYSQRGNGLMHVAGVIKQYCENHNVDTLIVDDVGIGAGVVDRLRELNLPVNRLIPFNGGQRPNDREHFADRNAEVWWAMRNRYLENNISARGSEALAAQVTGREYAITGNGRIRLQSKRSLTESIDEADALAMTFAPVPAFKNAPAAQRPTLKIWV